VRLRPSYTSDSPAAAAAAAVSAMALDLASPLIPGGFMIMASLGSVARAMVRGNTLILRGLAGDSAILYTQWSNVACIRLLSAGRCTACSSLVVSAR
jgi:hypothetical protein